MTIDRTPNKFGLTTAKVAGKQWMRLTRNRPQWRLNEETYTYPVAYSDHDATQAWKEELLEFRWLSGK